MCERERKSVYMCGVRVCRAGISLCLCLSLARARARALSLSDDVS